METKLSASQKSLYETDFVRWVETTVNHLRAQDYANAREQAADETELPLETFPLECPFTSEQSLNSEFLPE